MFKYSEHNLLFLCFALPFSAAQIYLKADSSSDAYKTIENVLGKNSYEVPDCGHGQFGHHITQARDSTYGGFVFTFHAHVNEDDDRCTNKDRQRTEIKTFGPSKDYLKGKQGEKVSYSWDFKLDQNFRPSSAFTHIHQIKAGDGNNAGSPLITLTPRKGNPNRLELIHVNSKKETNRLRTAPLADFLGDWIHVVEEMTLTSKGRYSVQIVRKSDGKSLFSYSANNLDLWRDGSTFMRPKWGIYRSLNDKGSLRNEKVGFANFCFAKGSDICK